jgi:hypothetical protein
MSLITMVGVTIIIIMVMVTIHTTLGIEATVIITPWAIVITPKSIGTQ